MTGDLSMVRLLLDHHARVSDQAPDGLRPLHAACAVGAVTVVRALLGTAPSTGTGGIGGSSTPSTDTGGSATPTSSTGGRINRGPSPSQILLAPGPHGQSALHVSVSNRMNPVSYLLLQHAQTIHKTLHSHDSASASDTTGGDGRINGQSDVDSDGDDDDEPFTLSSFVEMRDDVEGATALHIAARQGGQNPDAISLLLAFGADIEAVMDGDDAHCETPLYLGNLLTLTTH